MNLFAFRISMLLSSFTFKALITFATATNLVDFSIPTLLLVLLLFVDLLQYYSILYRVKNYLL